MNKEKLSIVMRIIWNTEGSIISREIEHLDGLTHGEY